MTENELLVSKIENGIVIDHIPAGKAFRVLKLLKLDPRARALIAQNVRSKSKDTKDLIKIEGTYLTSTELDIIALWNGGISRISTTSLAPAIRALALPR